MVCTYTDERVIVKMHTKINTYITHIIFILKVWHIGWNTSLVEHCFSSQLCDFLLILCLDKLDVFTGDPVSPYLVQRQ